MAPKPKYIRYYLWSGASLFGQK